MLFYVPVIKKKLELAFSLQVKSHENCSKEIYLSGYFVTTTKYSAVAHNCHGETKSHGKTKLTHGKTKKTSWSAVVICI